MRGALRKELERRGWVRWSMRKVEELEWSKSRKRERRSSIKNRE